MKNWGIVCICIGAVLLLSGIAFAEGYREDQGFIHNAWHMEVVFHQGQSPAGEALSEAAYQGRLSVKCAWFVAAGAVIEALGLFLLLAGRREPVAGNS